MKIRIAQCAVFAESLRDTSKVPAGQRDKEVINYPGSDNQPSGVLSYLALLCMYPIRVCD